MSIAGPTNFNLKTYILPNELRSDENNAITNNLNMNYNKLINLSTPTNNQDAVTKNYCDTNSLVAESNCLLLNGINSMDGNIDMNTHKLRNISDPTNNQDAVTKNYLTNYHDNTKINKSGDSMSGDLNMVYNKIINILNPTSNQEAATKNYVDNVLNGSNLFISTNAGNTSLAGVCYIGLGAIALRNLTSGTANTIIGYAAEPNINAEQNNVSIGYNSLALCATGSNNNVFRVNSFTKILTGDIIIGSSSGNNFLGAESNIFIIGNTFTGTIGESNTIRIGGTGTSTTIITGIYGKVSSGGVPVYVNSNQILGTITSSRRFKGNIIDAKKYDISKFRVVNINYIDDPDNIQVGLIAVEVAEIYPELIAYDENNMPYTVRYMELISILLQKVQKLDNKINLL